MPGKPCIVANMCTFNATAAAHNHRADSKWRWVACWCRPCTRCQIHEFTYPSVDAGQPAAAAWGGCVMRPEGSSSGRRRRQGWADIEVGTGCSRGVLHLHLVKTVGAWLWNKLHWEQPACAATCWDEPPWGLGDAGRHFAGMHTERGKMCRTATCAGEQTGCLKSSGAFCGLVQ